jgi:hypothetical protein
MFAVLRLIDVLVVGRATKFEASEKEYEDERAVK